MEQTDRTTDGRLMEYAIFNVGDVICGLNIDSVREINRNLELTQVHLSPDYVKGVINLRGQIVTVIDLRRKFEMEPQELNEKMRIMVVRSGEEDIGLLVDGVDDIATTIEDEADPPPPHISGGVGQYLSGVYKMHQRLVCILDVEKLLRLEEAA